MRYNPFYCNDEDYMSVVNMVFGSFNLHDKFFAKHTAELFGGHRSRAGAYRSEVQFL